MTANYKNQLTIARQCIIGLCLVLLMTFAWASPFWNCTAKADSLKSSTEETIRELDKKGKSALDEIAGAGTSSKIEGKIDRVSGELQERSEKAGAELKGAAKQARGKAKEGIGTVQEKMEEASEGAEETSENMFDSMKAFFGQE